MTDSATANSPGPQIERIRSNRDWWPNALNLRVLDQPSERANPMGKDFNYAAEFKHRRPRRAEAGRRSR